MKMKDFELDKLREGVRQFLMEIEEKFYLNWVGKLDDINIVGIYKKYSDLFTSELIEKVKSLKPRNDEEKRLFKRLLSLLIMTYAEKETKELIEKKLNVEATSSFELNGKKIPYRATGPIMANEPDRHVRIKMHEEMVKLKLPTSVWAKVKCS